MGPISTVYVGTLNRFTSMIGCLRFVCLLVCLSYCWLVSAALAQSFVPTHPVDGTYVKEWLVLGPFFPDDLETDFLAAVGGEEGIEPQEGDTVTTAAGETLTWKRYRARGHAINLIDAIGHHENATAYAYCVLQSDIAGDAELHFTSNNHEDDFALWINGELESNLRVGANPCLFKTVHGVGFWDFALQFFPPNSAVIAGVVIDKEGNSVPDAEIRLEQDGVKIAATQSDSWGNYLINVYPVSGQYDLAVTKGAVGTWDLDIGLRQGEHLETVHELKVANSLSGILQMPYDTTPHVAVPVEALRISPGEHGAEIVATTLSDERGKYQFFNLKPGRYTIRCQILDGHVYHTAPSSTPEIPGKAQLSSQQLAEATVLEMGSATSLSNIDFLFVPFKKGTWRSYSTLDGLADDNVLGIHGSPDGVLWFGTRAGASRYDGTKFLTLTAQDGMTNVYVNAIDTGPDGTIWMGTEDGVSWYDRITVTPFDTVGLADCLVLDLDIAPDGMIWMATDRGLFRYDGRVQPSQVRASAGLVEPLAALAGVRTADIHSATDGTVWFGTANGVYRYDGTTFVNLTTADGLVNDFVTAIYRGADGTMWFGTAGGLSRYSPSDGLFSNLTTADGLVDNFINAVRVATDGVVWMATDGGVSRYDGHTFVNYTTADGLADNHVWALYQDLSSNWWFGTEKGGVSYYDEKTFVNFTTKDGLASNDVAEIYIDTDGTMWFGTGYSATDGGGVSHYDGKAFVNFTIEHGLAANTVHAIERASDGSLWFGTLGGGVSRYDGTTFETLNTTDGLLSDYVEVIYCDPEGVLWLGMGYIGDPGGGGVSRYDGQSFDHFTIANGLRPGPIANIYRDLDGVMWFGTIGEIGSVSGVTGGVLRYDGQGFLNFTTADGLAGNYVYSIHQDADGTMWFGSSDGGLSRYDGQSFVNFTTTDGLGSNYVQDGLYRAADGILWVGTANGVSGSINGEIWTTLDTRDGLAGNEVRKIQQDADGYLWFATTTGVSRYQRSATEPEVRIDSVQIGGVKYVDLEALPSVAYGSSITIDYRAIDFKTIPTKRQYQYRFLEKSADWSRPTKATTFDSTFSSAGIYTFEVRAIDRDLRYSDPALVTFEVNPPYVQIALVSGLILLSVALVFTGRYGLRRRQAQRQAELALLARVEQELDDARQLQLSMLPSDTPALPHLDIRWHMETATEVGGDYYDYALAEDGTLTVAVGDATGHGMAAGTLVSATKSMFQTLSSQDSITEILTAMSRNLKSMNMRRIGMAMNMIKIKDRTLQFSSAGIPPMLLYRAASQSVEEVLVEGLPLGLSARVEYEQQTFELQSGDTILLMSDGLPERSNEAGEDLDYPRIQALFSDVAQATPDEIIQRLWQAGEDWAQGQPREDDITLVVLKMKA